MRKVLARLVLVLFSFLITWLMMEVFLRLGFDLLPPGIQGDIQGVRRVPWSEETIIPAQPFIIDRDFQVRMPVGLKDFPVRWSDARFTYDTISAWEEHRAGLRSDPPQWPLDIMTFGDSFTWCWTAWQDCWVKRLNTDRGWHVFNAAIPGTGATGQFNLMKELVPPMKPKLIIWLWFPNDMSDDYDLARIRGEVEELSKGPYPEPVAPPIGFASISAVWKVIEARLTPPSTASPYRHYQELILNGRPVSMHTDEYPHPYALVYGDTRYGIERNLEAHRQAIILAQQNGAVLLSVFLPVKEEAYADLLVNTLPQPYIDAIGEARRTLLQQCAANNWFCIDALPSLKEAVDAGQTVFYAFDSHLDAVGNSVLSATIADYIRANNLLPVPNE